ncbi:MAG TPA: hypothetical protein P5084_01020 [Paludibacter sp.]|nr:hypothetical protein [Paludibacter sp.]
MKKLLLLFAIALFAASCEGPRGPEGPQGEGTNWEVINIKVRSSDWVRNTDANNAVYYSALVTVPELTEFIYDFGNVINYVDYGTSQQTLPSVRHNKDKDNNLWTTTIDYDFAIGNVKYYVTNSDFFDEKPADMYFRLVLMW